MSTQSDLKGLAGKNNLLGMLTTYFARNANKMFDSLLVHQVNNDPFVHIRQYSNAVRASDGSKSSSSTDVVMNVDISLDSTSVNLDYAAFKSTYGKRERAAATGLPFDLPQSYITEHAKQVMTDITKKHATILTASTFAAAQKDAATAVWSTTSSDTRADIDKIKSKLMTGSNIQANDPRVVLLVSYNSAVEAMATTGYKTWEAAANGPQPGATLEDRLAAFWNVPKVIILDYSYPTITSGAQSGVAVYTDICDLVVIDRTGMSGALFAASDSIPSNDSGLCLALLQDNDTFAESFRLETPSGLYADMINSFITLSVDKQGSNTMLETSIGYKLYVHKAECLVGLTGI